jgi:hypothetical protein
MQNILKEEKYFALATPKKRPIRQKNTPKNYP